MTPAYLVRHAKSLDRHTWTEPDELRPLSKAGLRQAAALPGHLGGVALERLVSSPFVRCVQTFEPLSESLGVTIERSDRLAEGASGGGALELLVALAADGPVALCTHGDVLFDALSELEAEHVPLPGSPACKKGSTWVLEVEAGGIRRGTYVEPPDVDGAGS